MLLLLDTRLAAPAALAGTKIRPRLLLRRLLEDFRLLEDRLEDLRLLDDFLEEELFLELEDFL